MCDNYSTNARKCVIKNLKYKLHNVFFAVINSVTNLKPLNLKNTTIKFFSIK